jgi:hypothetical protein
MIPVVQSRTGADGNCLNACIASILELPLKAVPELGEDWLGDLNRFLAHYGLRYRRVPMYKKPSGWSTIEGVSPRGGLHACVAKDGELAWDPHPIEDGTGQGLVEPRYYGLLEPIRISGGDWSVYDERASRARDSSGRNVQKNETAATKRGRVFSRGAESVEVSELRRDIAVRKRVLASGKLSPSDSAYAKERLAVQERKLAELLSRTDDRADMATLRRNTERQGGPFFMQVTEKSGREHTIPVKEVAKGADSTTDWALLLAAIYALYKRRQQRCTNYDLTTYRPRPRAFDAKADRYSMREILDTLGIDIKEYMRRTEKQKSELLRTAIERLEHR